MADNDNSNDEYHFSETDPLGNEPMDEHDLESNPSHYSEAGSPPGQKDVKRNALIVVVLVLFAFLLYKIAGVVFSKKAETVKPAITEIAPMPTQPVVTAPLVEVPVNPSVPDLKQKLSTLELTQSTLRTDVTSLNEQMGGVNNSINTLNEQMTKLNQLMTDLSNQIARQSEEINVLMVRTRPRPVKHAPAHQRQRIIYHLKAIIPGRAWLIGSNGSTLTVREGSVIAGYGVVKLIDSVQGRVLMRSGHVIRFSQEDS